jgi:NifU-like protein
LVDVEGNRVLVSFRKACAQCPVAPFTMKEIVEAPLRQFVSEDIVVEEVKP